MKRIAALAGIPALVLIVAGAGVLLATEFGHVTSREAVRSLTAIGAGLLALVCAVGITWLVTIVASGKPE